MFLADARGGDDAGATARGVRAALDAAPPAVVVTLGGLGTDRDTIEATLGPLATGAPWVVVAIPGDREAIPEHRAAIGRLAAAGAPVVDGSQVRVIELPGVRVGTLPGVPWRTRLAAGVDGCVHDVDDLAALLDALTGPPGGDVGDDRPTTILATQTPPRQQGAFDLAPGGVHVGEIALAAALVDRGLDVVAQGAVDDLPRAAGAARRGAAPLFVPVGALDATPRYLADGTRVVPTGVTVTAGPRDVAWEPLRPRVLP
ncbi:MAG: hypothetical protein H6708_09225 [Kofleriaceae bacterium]|nr:hypothetical protein [Kofleriaceae bacterium]